MTQQVLKAEDPVYGGYVINRAEGIVFIKGAIPGEVVEVQVEEKKRDYLVASVVDIVEPSPHRMEPTCQHFGQCGGCHLQFIDYHEQVRMKRHVLLDCLKRIGGMEISEVDALYGPEFGYRMRAQFKVSKEGATGFYKEGTREIVPIVSCPLMDDRINDLYAKVRVSELGDIREVHISVGETAALALLKGVQYDEAIANRFMDMGFTGVAFDDGRYLGSGPSYIDLDLNGLKYYVSPWSFFQSNWELNKRLVTILTQSIGETEGRAILDLYAGAGNFSLEPSIKARLTTAVEENPYAAEDAKRNALQNRVSNYKIIKAPAESPKITGEYDIVLLDPPRPGLTNAAMAKVLEVAPQTIAYVSCNPSTFARDLKRLSDKYEVGPVTMIDLFPNTYHVESFTVLTRKPQPAAGQPQA